MSQNPEDLFSVPPSSLGTEVEELPEDSDYLPHEPIPESQPPRSPPPADTRDVAMVPKHIQSYSPDESPQLKRPMAYTAQNRSYPLGQVSSSTVSVGAPLVLAGAGAVAGGMYAGAYGAGAGLLLTGAIINGYRFAVDMTEERKTYGTFAVITALAGGYLAYKAYQKKEGAK